MSRLPAVRLLFTEIGRLLGEINDACIIGDVYRFGSATRAWDNWRNSYIRDELALGSKDPKDSLGSAVDPARDDLLLLAAEELRGLIDRTTGASGYLNLPDKLMQSRKRAICVGVGAARTPAEFRAMPHYEELLGVLRELRVIQHHLGSCIAYFGIEPVWPNAARPDGGPPPDKLLWKRQLTGGMARQPLLRGSKRGSREILIATLTKHHKYDNGSCQNWKPIGNNELAREAGVAPATASAFFNKEFKGHDKYEGLCQDSSGLIAALKLLNGEFSPYTLYERPPGEGNRGEE